MKIRSILVGASRASALVALTIACACAGSMANSGGSGVAESGAKGLPRGDWKSDSPGTKHKYTAAELPKPYSTDSVDNGPSLTKRPDGAKPVVPAGFKVELFATDLDNPRVIVAAPNGDLFVAESNANRVRILRDADGDGKPEVNQVFAAGLNQPFGIAFYPPGNDPQFLYVANTDTVVRFPYKSGALEAGGSAQTIVPDVPGGGRLRGGGHWTRDVAFSLDGSKMWVSVGSHSNVDDDPKQEERRADILQYNPDGTGYKLYASGIRNPVGLAVNPDNGELWTSVNERDGLGDDLVPDYITRVKEGGFYGWPWYYIGGNQDPRHQGKHPELKDKVIVPDVLVQSHSASLDLTFYNGAQFPAEYRGSVFACFHGSWNRAVRTGYKVVRVPVVNGVPTGEYEDFMTGFVTADNAVWGRPVGVAVGKDGSLFVTDDGSRSVWRVTAAGAK